MERWHAIKSHSDPEPKSGEIATSFTQQHLGSGSNIFQPDGDASDAIITCKSEFKPSRVGRPSPWHLFEYLFNKPPSSNLFETRMSTSSQSIRRSLRISTSKPLTTQSCPTIQGSQQLDATDFNDQPLRKHRKTLINNAGDKPTHKSRRGKLQDLPNMPLDILFDIFGHLLPLDVLRLARTSKALRNVVMRRSARSIWRTAFFNLPVLPPPRPDDLTEPGWASLLFDTHCSVSLFRFIPYLRTLNASSSCRSSARDLASPWFHGCSAFAAARNVFPSVAGNTYSFQMNFNKC